LVELFEENLVQFNTTQCYIVEIRQSKNFRKGWNIS